MTAQDIPQDLCFNCAYRQPLWNADGKELLKGRCTNIFSAHCEAVVWPAWHCPWHTRVYDMTLDAGFLMDSPCQR